MRKLRKLTKELCFEIATACKDRGDLRQKDESVYNKCRKTGWLDEIFPKVLEGNHPSKYGYKYQKAWKEKNKEAIAKQQAEYRSKPCTRTKDRIRAAKYRASLEGKAKRLAYQRKREFIKRTSSRNLCEAHSKEIESVYKKCALMTKRDGVEYQVDHIVPLKGKTICGLHVPWNLQIITKEENMSKGNSFDVGG